MGPSLCKGLTYKSQISVYDLDVMKRVNYVENNKIMKFWNKIKLNEYIEDGRMYLQIQSDVVYFWGVMQVIGITVKFLSYRYAS